MRVSSLLAVLAAAALSTTGTEAAPTKCTLSVPQVKGEVWRYNEWSPLESQASFETEIEYRGGGDVTVGFNLFKALRSMVMHHSFPIWELPGEQYDKSVGNFWKGVESATTFRSYAVHAHPDGTYTEVVGVSHSASPHVEDFLDDKLAVVDEYITGKEAREYLQGHVYGNKMFRPLLFAFEMVHRMVSPAGLLPMVFDSIFDPNNEKYTKTKNGMFGPPARHHMFHTSDKAARYTPDQLNKIFTPIPPPLPKDPSLPAAFRLSPVWGHEEDGIYTPVETVEAEVEEARRGAGSVNGFVLGRITFAWEKYDSFIIKNRKMIELKCIDRIF